MDDPDARARLRASDADREAVADQLREAFAEGRLDVDEYGRRLDETFGARTYADLEPITADLPAVPARRADPGEVASPDDDDEDDAGGWREWLGTALILNVIWGLTSFAGGEPAFYWPMFPLGIWAAVILASYVWGDDD